MCEAFARAGHEVELVVPRKKANPVKEDLFDYYGVERNFRVRYVNTLSFMRFEHYIGRLSYYIEVLSFLLVLSFIRIDKGAVVFTRDADIAWLFGLRMHTSVLEVHSLPKRHRWLYRRFLRRTIRVVALTGKLKERLQGLGVSEDKITVEPDAVDLAKFDIQVSREESRKRLDLPQDKKLIGYTGSFRTMGEDKGLTDIFHAVQELGKKRQDFEFVAVGGTDKDIGYYSDLAESMNVSDYVRLLARVDIATLAIYQKAFDALLMTYPDEPHYREEMSPLKMFEYMASKRPIITSDLPTIRDVLDEESALFFQPGDTKELADKIYYLLDNPEEGEKKAEKGYERVKSFTWEQRAQRVLKFIEIEKLGN
jgi:glycosyltransferase involved in cell wall biosynthesis